MAFKPSSKISRTCFLCFVIANCLKFFIIIQLNYTTTKNMFKDRHEAGEILAEKLKNLNIKNGVVLAIPRGGVEVGKVLADKLNLSLDVVCPKKITPHDNPEFAIGAVMPDGTFVLDERMVSYLGLSESYLENEIKSKMQEAKRREKVFRGDKEYNLENKTVIITDDGIATGYTMKAALKWLEKQKPKDIVVAVPVLPQEALKDFKNYKLVYIDAPWYFEAVGQFYENFPQLSDEEVLKILRNN